MTPPEPAPPEGAWVLVAPGGSDAVDVGPAGDAGAGPVPDLRLVGGEVTGSGGVNRFRGTYESTSAGLLRLSPLMSTRMAGAPEANARETAYLAALAGVVGFEVRPGGDGDADELLLRDGNGSTVLTLRRAPAQAASWRG